MLFKEVFSQRQIALKLKVSRHGVWYSLQRQLETPVNVGRKRVGVPQITIAAEDKHFIIESKRNRN